jgi:hypothetical protein
MKIIYIPMLFRKFLVHSQATPKINIMGASNYGQFKFLLPEFSQMIFSPGPLIFKLRKGLKNFKPEDYLLLTGDPAIIGVACSIVSDITNGKYKYQMGQTRKKILSY